MKKEWKPEQEKNIYDKTDRDSATNAEKMLWTVYMAVMIAIIVFLCILYQKSYNKKIVKNNNGISYVLLQTEDNILKNDVVFTEKQQADKVMPNTEYILETYNITTGEGFSETLSIPPELVGLDRNEVLSYLNEYMMEMPLEEYEKGLLSCELISFSEKTIVLKKTYNSDAVLYKYYLVVEDNIVVVYYCDKKTVYEYTGISASDLDMEERIRLSKGIEVETEEELYGILENYSS